MARQIENILYRAAPSYEVYVDHTTIPCRIKHVVTRLAQRTMFEDRNSKKLIKTAQSA